MLSIICYFNINIEKHMNLQIHRCEMCYMYISDREFIEFVRFSPFNTLLETLSNKNWSKDNILISFSPPPHTTFSHPATRNPESIMANLDRDPIINDCWPIASLPDYLPTACMSACLPKFDRLIRDYCMGRCVTLRVAKWE